MYLTHWMVTLFALFRIMLLYTSTYEDICSGLSACICSSVLYSTPLVLGTSSPPVLWIASRIASASALNADSALSRIPVSMSS